MDENLDLLHRSLKAWNRQDLATYAELYAPDAVIRGLAPEPLGVEGMLGVSQAFFAGFPAGAMTQIDPNLVHYRELTISGSANATLDDYAAAVEALSSGRIDLSPLITHEYELSDVGDALEAVRTRAGLKVAVRPKGFAAL